MDDVLIVVGLLVFGSSLFCLCCYKVSNLLYMLYHIDDVESVAGDISAAAITTATAALAVAAPSNTAAAPNPASPPVDKTDAAKHAIKNNGTVSTGTGIYAHLNHVAAASRASNTPVSPDVEGKATSMITLVPSSSSVSLANEHKKIQKAGKQSLFFFKIVALWLFLAWF